MIETADDAIPETETVSKSSLMAWLDRAIVFWVFVLALAAPHSIAATQIAWLCGMAVWGARFLLRPRPRLPRTPVDFPLLGFLLLTVISSFLSYDPGVSLGKLRAASLFSIAYLVAGNVLRKRVLHLLVLTIIASCMINVFCTLGERVVGRGVRVEGVSENSPLRAAVFVTADQREDPTPIQSGDTILEIDGRPLKNPEALVATLDDPTYPPTDFLLAKIYRVEWTPVLKIPRRRLLPGTTILERLGVASWSPGREWRAAGFYGHYTTYAETLQLIASLALGLFIANVRKRKLHAVLLLLALAGMAGALLLTVTRASWVAFLLSAFVITLVGTRRRTAIAVAAFAIPVVLIGLFVLQQQRNVGFYDRSDHSIIWRETVWREGFNLLRSKPRHLLVGVGMDSIKGHWREWGLFDQGRLPLGHMHSTPLQIALERGVPALVLWILFVAVYARMLLRLARRRELDWIQRGLVLGALGGLAGFIASGMVHYNFGDSEVVMIFYFIMGLSLAVEQGLRDRGENHM